MAGLTNAVNPVPPWRCFPRCLNPCPTGHAVDQSPATVYRPVAGLNKAVNTVTPCPSGHAVNQSPAMEVIPWLV